VDRLLKSTKIETTLCQFGIIKTTNISEMSSTPMYTRQVTVEQMEEEKRRATAEGMREIAAALAARQINNPEEDFMSSDSECYSEPRARKPKVVHIDRGATEKLESRNHYLQLELSNALVDVEDANAKVDGLSKALAPYKKLNDELAFLKGALDRALLNTDKLTGAQLYSKLKLFQEEATEHASLSLVSLNKIEQLEIKAGLTRLLAAEKKRFIKVENSFKWIVFMTQTKEASIRLFTTTSVVIVLFAILYQLCLWLLA